MLIVSNNHHVCSGLHNAQPLLIEIRAGIGATNEIGPSLDRSAPTPPLFTLPESVLRLCIPIQVRATYRGIDPIAKQKILLQLDHGINAVATSESGL